MRAILACLYAAGMPATPSHRRASRELAERDPTMRALVERHGPMRVGTRPAVGQRFEVLSRAIAHQQLAGRAAQSIWGRVRALVPGPFEPAAVLALDPSRLRAAGLSGAKTAAILDLSRLSVTGDIRLDRVGRMPDDEVVAMLTRARGIGPWTAHMFLMSSLHRLDVWPTGDYGVRVGFARAWGLDATPSERELAPLGEPYRPYRSVVAWYCWREVDQ
jgi:DNA-3-methyladenine glycosylase II